MQNSDGSPIWRGMSTKVFAHEAKFELTKHRSYADVISAVDDVENVGTFKANGWQKARQTGQAVLRFRTENEMLLAKLGVD